MSRQVRVETRSRHQNDLKRVMHSTEKVRKWEKKWVRIEETSLQIFKWMPITKNEEQQRQQIQEQVATPVRTSGSSDKLQKQPLVKSDVGPNNPVLSTMPIRIQGGESTTTTSNSNKINEAEDKNKIGSLPSINVNQRPIDNGETKSTTIASTDIASTLQSNNPNKRPHEGSDDANESINSPDTKRVKTTADILTTTSIPVELVDNSSTFASMHSADSLSLSIATPEAPSRLQQVNETTTSHFPHRAEASAIIAQQQHVQPSTTTTTAASMHNPANTCTDDNDTGPKLTPTNSHGDIEMMDTDEIVAGDICNAQQQQQQQQHDQQLPSAPSAVSNMTDALMEDFSSIVRNVTEQIVLKVSDSYGGDE